MSLAWWLNTAWMLKCGGEERAFHRATHSVAAAQWAILADTLRHNRHTEFGRTHGFADIRNVRTYQARVPLSSYDDYAVAIERMAAGAGNVLTRERPLLLEPTSGSTGGEKLIPYTAGLRRQFQRGVATWIADLFAQRPAARGGRAYWSISPAVGARRCTSAGIPIGFDDDAGYLGTLERLALDRLLIVPAAVARLEDPESFRYCTLFHLLAAGDLALISIWNPTFITALLAPLEDWAERLCRDVRDGLPRPPVRLTAALSRQFTRAPDRRRAAYLEEVFRTHLPFAERLRLIWPRLAMISCWADAAAARCVSEVRELFPDVEIQPKGLLATEGCVSVPLVSRPAPVLAIRSHFFEFQPVEDERSECRLAHELDAGARYRVIITTAGGLYRYQLRDEVEVAGFENECPLVRFVGKADRVSDLVGEKLAEPHVRVVLDRALAALRLMPRFALIVPVEGRPSRYCLYVQTAALTASVIAALQEQVELGLGENPHYGYAVRVGQLRPLEIRLLDAAGESGWRVYERHCVARGQRLGNIKPTALDAWTGWAGVFDAQTQPVRLRLSGT